MPGDGGVEVGLGPLPTLYRIREPAPELGYVERRPLGHRLRHPGVMGRNGDLLQGWIVSLSSHQAHATYGGGLLAREHQRPLSAVHLQPVAAAVPGHAAHLGGCHRSALQRAAHEDVVGRGHVHHPIGVAFVPAGDAGADHRRHLFELAQAHAHGVDRMAEGYGQGGGAQGVVTLPRSPRRPG